MALKDAETKPLDTDRIRELNLDELREELTRLRDAQFRLTFRSATEPVENPAQFRMLRRNIARMETILRERQRAS
jgi:large subunit ribosomal protein L29